MMLFLLFNPLVVFCVTTFAIDGAIADKGTALFAEIKIQHFCL